MLANFEAICKEKLHGRCGRIRAYFTSNGAICLLAGVIGLLAALLKTDLSIAGTALLLFVAGAVQLYFTTFLFLKNFNNHEKAAVVRYQLLYGLIVFLMINLFFLKVCLVYYIYRFFFRRVWRLRAY